MKYIDITKPGDNFKVIQLVPETKEEIREQEEYSKWWNSVHCTCKNSDMSNWYYVPDHQDKECDKHHWRCKKCHGITQIG